MLTKRDSLKVGPSKTLETKCVASAPLQDHATGHTSSTLKILKFSSSVLLKKKKTRWSEFIVEYWKRTCGFS